jgi:hypothetical protein
MTHRRSFVRKVIYVAVMAGLLTPIYWLARPAVNAGGGDSGDPGGILAQLRDRYQLGQSSLGGIDPAGETIKLSVLGMRGIAANILWTKAGTFQMKKDWDSLSATLEQIAKVQPNFVSVWRYQAWNLSYNCSAEFDDYHERYRWLIKGIDYLKEGIEHNRRAPGLQWNVGWVCSNKIGKADEVKQYRRLFKQDNDFHGSTPIAERDNWLVGRKWFQDTERLVDREGAAFHDVAPLVYRCDAPLCLMYYAIAKEADGVFGETARRTWRSAADDWQRYGTIDIPFSDDTIIRLGDKEVCVERTKQLYAVLDAFQPGLRKQMVDAKRARLSAEQRKALDTPLQGRTKKEYYLARASEPLIRVAAAELAQRIPIEQRKKAQELAGQIEQVETTAEIIQRDRDVVGWDAWTLRAQWEQEDEAISARAEIYAGDQAFADARVVPARQAYDRGLAAWRKVLDTRPVLLQSTAIRTELLGVVNNYKTILAKREETLPLHFVLHDVVEFDELVAEAAKRK